MKSNDNLLPQYWQNVYNACREYTKEFLLEAANAALSQREMPLIDINGAEHISHECLARLIVQLIKETNAGDENRLQLWIDPKGKYKISTNTQKYNNDH